MEVEKKKVWTWLDLAVEQWKLIFIMNMLKHGNIDILRTS